MFGLVRKNEEAGVAAREDDENMCETGVLRHSGGENARERQRSR
jgi:hypothetical protein